MRCKQFHHRRSVPSRGREPSDTVRALPLKWVECEWEASPPASARPTYLDPDMDADETAVAEQQTASMVAEPKAKPDKKKREVPRYHVILWDSDAHSYEYVEKMLKELFGHTDEQCHKMAETVDTHGKVIVLTTTKEHGELKRAQILAYGNDENFLGCKGSLHSTIESAG